MLSDEEREAIEWLKRLVKLNKRDNLDDTFAEILLNLIEKQSKEIEELKDSNNKLYNILQDNKQQTKYSLENNDKKWEDKIKAKIEELDNQKRQWIEDRNNKHKDSELIYAIEVLQSLLEEDK